ncbi:sigma factor-like helix-turn-helix DNA-binding protein [Frankia sp. CcI49]|uniref:sigma factor-like helix-turn-helix DNA-binding protein n=1 Tax=Frankia sp. CcI49 TaxID=1745382 RepID=UPI0013047B92|nr:sigma factor-like helix-turn-helix DNA-binding protein [Frankia sp. CcI49]
MHQYLDGAERASNSTPNWRSGVVRFSGSMYEGGQGLRAAARRSRGALHEVRATLAKALAVNETALQPQPSQSAEQAQPKPRPDNAQAQVRDALATVIAQQSPGLAGVAGEVALAVHPWPDVAVTRQFREAVAEQLNPWLNARHPDVREVTTDRLRRLAEVFRDHCLPSTALAELEDAAARLTDMATARTPYPAGEVPVPPQLLAAGEPAPAGQPALAAIAAGSATVDTATLAVVMAAVARTGSSDLGVVLGSSPVGVSVAALVRTTGLVELLQPFDDWIGGLSPREHDILTRRILAFGEVPTLGELGVVWGCSRERIRQVETKLDDHVAAFRSRWNDLAPAFEPLRAVIWPTRSFELACMAMGSGLAHPTAVAMAAARSAGPWNHQQGWTSHPSLKARLDEARLRVRDGADEVGLLPEDAPSHLDGLFATTDDRDKYLHSILGITRLSGYWALRETLRARVLAALRRLGRPATKEEIAEFAGLNPEEQDIGGTLSNIDSVVRADKTHWGLREWVDEAYDGIVAAIGRRIDANQGSIAVATLLDELPHQFGVKASSIMAYLATSVFVVADGVVRRAEGDSFVPSSPTRWADTFRIDGLWGQRIRLEERHFRGYSMKIRFDVAYANGVRPNDDLRVPVEDTDHEASVIWRPHDAGGAVDVGRVTAVLTEGGYTAGDQVVICPSRERVRIARADSSCVEDPRVAVAEPTARGENTDGGYNDPLLDLLGGS